MGEVFSVPALTSPLGSRGFACSAQPPIRTAARFPKGLDAGVLAAGQISQTVKVTDVLRQARGDGDSRTCLSRLARGRSARACPVDFPSGWPAGALP